MQSYLADQGEAWGCSINTSVIDWLNNWFILCENIFKALPCPTALVEDGAFSHKIDYFGIFFGDYKSWRARATILMNGWILPIGGVAMGMVCAAAGLLRYIQQYLGPIQSW